MEDGAAVRRSLILAGGGSKVAFQAGVLQVWLDEAHATFDHADAASGGVLNLAMLCQGMTGTQIADNWRAYRPMSAIEPDVGQLVALPFARSLFRLGRFRRNVLAKWKLDWPAIQASALPATFNLYNFSDHEHEVLEPKAMDEDRLISAVSLPMWFPPVRIDGKTYVDAVFVTDANLEAAIRRGADEIWVIWTVSRRGRWARGLVSHYFQMIEAMANAQFKAILDRIERSNAAIGAGEHAEFDRPIDVKVLYAEVPLHYLLNFTRDRVRAAVELGVHAGRRWCAEEGIAREPPQPARPEPTYRRGLRFTEKMSGHVGFGASDFDTGAEQGWADDTPLSCLLRIEIDDIDRFLVMPAHEARADGWIDAPAFGGRCQVERGTFNLFVDQDDPSDKRMFYRLWFHDRSGRPLTLDGHKVVHDDPGLDLWRDTTTLLTRVLDGHVGPEPNKAEIVASGVIRISAMQFARQLTTFRADAPTRLERLEVIARFGRLFLGGLWDVYGREVVLGS